jgi:hypothetical protein
MLNSKNIITLLASVIIILGVFLTYWMILKSKSDDKLNFKQEMIDKTFKYQLGESASSFGKELSDGNNNNYEQCVASVAAASSLAKLSSYEANNDSIDVGLDGFYKALINADKKEVVIKNAEEIRNIFIKLNLDPTDSETTKELNNLVQSFYK